MYRINVKTFEPIPQTCRSMPNWFAVTRDRDPRTVRRLQVINQIIFFNIDFILFWEIYTIKNFIFSQFEVDTNENKEIAELEPNSSITSPM